MFWKIHLLSINPVYIITVDHSFWGHTFKSYFIIIVLSLWHISLGNLNNIHCHVVFIRNLIIAFLIKRWPWIVINAHRRMNGNAWIANWLKVSWCRQIVVMCTMRVIASNQSAVMEVFITRLDFYCRVCTSVLLLSVSAWKRSLIETKKDNLI